MKLNVYAENGESILESWWNGLEWQQHEPIHTFGDRCNAVSLIEETFCYADLGAHAVMDAAKMEWLYKIINFYTQQTACAIQEGVYQEYQNFLEMLQCFPC